LKPPRGIRETVKVADCPGFTVVLEGEEVIPKSAPWPERATVWGLSGALSVIDSVAEDDPEVDGSKVMEMVQVAPTPRLGGHGLFEVVKPTFGGEMPTSVMLTAVSPVLVTTTD